MATALSAGVDRPRELDVDRALRRVELRGPWRWHDLTLVVRGHALGFGLISVSWWNIRSNDDVGSQLSWVCLAVLGLVVSGFASARWFLRGRRAIGAARVALLPEPAATAEASTRQLADVVVSGPGMTRYHRPSCALVSARKVTSGTDARRGKQPCDVCEP